MVVGMVWGLVSFRVLWRFRQSNAQLWFLSLSLSLSEKISFFLGKRDTLLPYYFLMLLFLGLSWCGLDVAHAHVRCLIIVAPLLYARF